MLTKPKPGATINMAHPLSKGLVGFWLFNEGSGDLANDISGNKNHGALKNMLPNAQGTKWQGTKFGGGLAFDGIDDYVDCGNVLNFERTDPFSIVVWIKTTDTVGMIVGKGSPSSPYNGYCLEVDSSKLAAHLINDYEAPNRIQVRETASGTINDGNCHQVAITYNGSSSASGVALYIDRVKIATTTSSDTLTATIINSRPLTMGKKEAGDYPRSFVGTIDEVRIYNRALSAKEIKTLYHNPFCNLLKIPIYQHYVLGAPHTNLGIGGTITDPSGNPIEGAIIKLENRTLGENLTNETSDVNGEYAMDLANLANQWSDGDVLILNAEARGYCQTVVTAADDSVPSLEINFDNIVMRILMVW